MCVPVSPRIIHYWSCGCILYLFAWVASAIHYVLDQLIVLSYYLQGFRFGKLIHGIYLKILLLHTLYIAKNSDALFQLSRLR